MKRIILSCVVVVLTSLFVSGCWHGHGGHGGRPGHHSSYQR